MHELGNKPEITRFKGLGEISPGRVRAVHRGGYAQGAGAAEPGAQIQKLLEYYMGKNTPQRQTFIIDNLRVEKDLVEEFGPMS